MQRSLSSSSTTTSIPSPTHNAHYNNNPLAFLSPVFPLSSIYLSLYLPPNHHHSRRALGIDYGARRVGLSLSAGYSFRALPSIIHNRNPEQVANNVSRIANGELVESIVVGLPLVGIDDDGTEGQQTKRTRLFVKILRNIWKGDVWLVDERDSSKEAREEKGKKSWEIVDGLAAGIILERFFDGVGIVEKIEGMGGGGKCLQMESVEEDVGDGKIREGWMEWKKRVRREVAELHVATQRSKKKR